jgi:ATP-dependent RNA helicase HrpA
MARTRASRSDAPGAGAVTRAAARARALEDLTTSGRLRIPEDLPIAAMHDELLETIRDHQVVVVAGETGSGKSTQLPKLCLALGRGVEGVIGHTQLRRVAARTIAARVAEELGTPLGDAVGYSVRFDDRITDATLVRVMTDGVLLAEVQRDRTLRRYDTLIVDEAHERSLNIDFILGYLRQLLPQRPDLKVIVTSATIDTERFARHFAAAGVDAPVVAITGRTYPVDVRYRPYGDMLDGGDERDERHQRDQRDQRDQVQAIVDAVEELGREGRGDILVFLSGEREIHDTADALRRVDSRDLRDTEVLPLYARLSSVEQHRIFAPHASRRIVLATNVAETSITVPGIRYVVDTGTARISRYSRRLKVQRLPIEPVSRASANQRAGRCGRVAPGICIRLYAEDDFLARPEYTEPEILRTNLASVILQMTAIGLGDVAAFPFVEPPDRSAVRDGYLVLDELGAIEADDGSGVRRLTNIGRRLARLPIDPRLGRMLLEADRLACVREVTVIVAALSIQDPRERPQEHRPSADELHRRFDVPGSDLLSIVALWDHLRDQQRRLSSNQFRKLCRAEFVNYLRVREWQDLYSQVRRVAGELGIRSGSEKTHGDDVHQEHVHQAVLAGLLSHVGVRERDAREFRGARGSTFVVASGSVLAKRPPRWVMAAELVETNRVWARRVAAIKPEWCERAGAHLVRRSYGEPRWDAGQGRAVTSETVTLYGLPIVSGRTIGLDRVDARLARDMFVRHALVDGDWHARHGFVAHNRAVVDRVRGLEARVRRSGLLDDDALFDFYAARVPPDVVSTRHFDRWLRGTGEPHVLDLDEDALASAIGVRPGDFPDTWRDGDLELPLTYRLDPGGPLDGVTVHVPLAVLNRLNPDRLGWQVPGHRTELVAALVRTLPKDIRRQLIPASETVRAAVARLPEPSGAIVDSLAVALSEVAAVPVSPDHFHPQRLPAHLLMHVVVHDADGSVVDAGTDLDAIRLRQAAAVRDAVAAAAPIAERRGIVDWDVGTVPSVVVSTSSGHEVRGHPALLDEGDSVSLRVLTRPELQQRVMRGGVRRLLLLTAAPTARALQRGLGRQARSSDLIVAATGTTLDELAADCAAAAVDRVLSDHELPWDAAAFEAVRADVRARAPAIAADALDAAVDVLVLAARVRDRLAALTADAWQPTVADATAHLGRLVRPGFVVTAGTRRLPDVLRYVRGIEHRIDRLGGDVARDRRRMDEVVPLERRYAAHLRTLDRRPAGADVIEVGWQLEELRVAVFAQSLGARGPVSPTRVARALAALGA